MNPLITGTVILFGLMVLGWLFQPAREQQVIIIREPAGEAMQNGGCGTLVVVGFLALLLLMLLFSGH